MAGWRAIGVIGGMGPAATANFMTRLVLAAEASEDSAHPRVFVDSNPDVPDRNAARLGQGPSPGPVLAAMARGLVSQGAELLAMPCNAAHGWATNIVTAVPVPFIDMIGAAVSETLLLQPRRVAIIAIGATLDARLYHDRLAAAGVETMDCDRTVVQPLVTRIKAGDFGTEVRRAMAAEAARLTRNGAEQVIAACTEVPLALDPADVAVPVIDATAALVRAVVATARLLPA